MTTYLSDLTVKFTLTRKDETIVKTATFSHYSDSLGYDVREHGDNLADELDDIDCNEHPEDWEVTDISVTAYDTDYKNPTDFDNLDDYGKYAAGIEKHGEAYHLRYDDIGESNFSDEYVGCHTNFGDYAWSIAEESGYTDRYFDLEAYASDLQHDYSTYQGSDGCHIFRD